MAAHAILFEVAEVDRGPLARVGLEPYDGGDLLLPAQRSSEPLDQVVATGVSLTSDLLEETDRGERILREPGLDVRLELIQ